MCVNHLCRALGLSQPNVSQHLLVLRETGLVDFHVKGSHRCYYILKPTLVRNMLELLSSDCPACIRPAEEVVAEIQAKWGDCTG